MKNGLKKVFIGLFIFICFLVNVSFSQEVSGEGFARFLFNKGEYYRAITEYYKMLYKATGLTEKISFLKNIGLCYLSGDDYENYITFYKNNRNVFLMRPKIYSEMNLYLGKSYYNINLYQEAISVLEGITFVSNDSLYNDKYFFTGLSYAHLHEWNSAFRNMEFVNGNSKYLRVRDHLNNHKEDLLNFSKKEPIFAGFLSALIPGAGYIYCDKLTTGITSLVVNGLLIWAFYDTINNNQYGLSASIGFFGLGWYIGNIIGSANAAHQYNSYYQEQYLNDILTDNLK